jgi:hypothetical protein
MKWFLSRVVDASVNTLLILRKTIRPGWHLKAWNHNWAPRIRHSVLGNCFYIATTSENCNRFDVSPSGVLLSLYKHPPPSSCVRWQCHVSFGCVDTRLDATRARVMRVASARVCPHAGGPAHCTSGVPVCSKIPYCSDWSSKLSSCCVLRHRGTSGGKVMVRTIHNMTNSASLPSTICFNLSAIASPHHWGRVRR